jgi:hypothetical protein
MTNFANLSEGTSPVTVRNTVTKFANHILLQSKDSDTNRFGRSASQGSYWISIKYPLDELTEQFSLSPRLISER